MAERPAASGRTFGPVVLLGLASAGLAAVAGTHIWMLPTASAGDSATLERSGALVGLSVEGGQVPVANALALVVLAAWGVLLVTRGRVRRLVAGLGTLAAAGALAATAWGWWSVPDTLRRGFEDIGVEGVGAAPQGWYWLAVAGGAGALATTAAAVWLVPTWPEMGRRYDAPATPAPSSTVSSEDPSSLDLWRTLDEGRDPTAAPD